MSADHDLLHYRHELADIIESLPDATFVIDLEGRILIWNKEMAKLTGFASQDMVGRGNYEYALAFYGVRRPILVDMVVDPRVEFDKEYVYIHREGDILTTEAAIGQLRGEEKLLWGRAAPLRNSQGQMVGAIETVRDITLRKKDEQELLDSQGQLREIIESSPDAMMVIDTEGIILHWNREMARITGFASQDMVGKGDYEYALAFYGERRPILIDMIIDPRVKFTTEYTYIHIEGATLTTETTIGKLQGEEKVLWGRAAPLHNSQGDLVGAIETVRDITERKLAAEALQQSHERLKLIYDGTVHALAITTEKRDYYTSGHQQRVAALASMIAREMGLDEHTIEHLNIAATLHDIGKLYIPLDILSQPSRLNDIQRLFVMNHSEAGYDIVKNIPFEGPVAQIIEQHHERLDGSGYPLGLKGDEILLEARILAVADTVEAMAAARPYRPAVGVEKALEEIQGNAGRLYDPAAVVACVKIIHENRFHFAVEL